MAVKSNRGVTLTKVVCAKCNKEYFVSFFADGRRDYYCDDCLKLMHLNRKRGKIKKVFNAKTKRFLYEFICDICGKYRRATYFPKHENGKIWCAECENNHKIEERKRARKNILIANVPNPSLFAPKNDKGKKDEESRGS